MHAPNLKDQKTVDDLTPRREPYWNILEYCRHLGLDKRPAKQAYWVARIRRKDGLYKRSRLGAAALQGAPGLTHAEAVDAAREWYASPEIARSAADPYPVGVRQTLRYTKTRAEFTVGDAMIGYVEWKRIAATKKTFDVLLSLINYHIIPRLGDLPVDEFTGERITAYYREVLETPPKRGNQERPPSVSISELGPDQLRKRKGTVNTIAGILRLAIQMAWENGHSDDERSWRCIRRLPNQEHPRQIFLTRAQCRELLGACRADLADLVRGALFTGCRIAELSELRVRDVGRDVFGVFIAPSKSSRSRYVYLPDEGMRFFLAKCKNRDDEDRLFLTQSNTAWDGRHKHLFREAVRRTGLPERFVFHGLRHTYASQLVQAGTPLAIVARQLGHANTDTVSRTYGHLSCASIEQELQMRFAPLEEPRGCSDERLKRLRASLQAEEPPLPVTSWPKSNFGRLEGTLIEQLKYR